MRPAPIPFALSCLLCPVALAQSPAWSPDFAPRGLLGAPLDSLVFDDGAGSELFVAGPLQAAGAQADAMLAAWNGHTWRKIPAVLQQYSGAVESASIRLLASFDSGSGAEFYAAGYFAEIEGVAARSIARRTSQGWAALGANTTAGDDLFITALRTVDLGGATALYVGHTFESVGGVAPSILSKWDGSTWSSVGSPLQGRVTDIAAFDDGGGVKLYVAGQSMWSTSPLPVSSVLAWDGATWSQVGGSSSGVVERLIVHDDGSGPALFAAGASDAIVGVARLSGASWTSLGAPVGGNVLDLALWPSVSGPRLAAVGSFNQLGAATSVGMAVWNGSTWANVGASGVTTAQNALPIANSVASGDLGDGPRMFTTGAFTRVDDVSALNVVTWDGSAFEALGGGAGLSSPVSALASYQGALYAGGLFVGAPGSSQPYLAKWTGVEWSADAPLLNQRVESLYSANPGNGERLLVSGVFTQPHPSFLAWDGAQSSPLGALNSNGLIRAQIARDEGNGTVLYVGGSFTSIGGVTARNVARWDGQSWSSLGLQSPNNAVHALEFFDDGQGGGEQLYAGGAFLQAGGQYVFGIARYDGASWHPVSHGFDSGVFALAVHDDGSGPKLYAGGAFRLAPPATALAIARWNGVSWQAVGAGLGSGPGSAVNALTSHDDGSGPALIAGGNFLVSGTTAMRNLARWQAGAWTEFAGGADGSVGVLRVLDDGTGLGSALWVGGSFHTVGDTVSSHLARWGKTCESESYCSSGLTSSGCAPSMGAVGRASASQVSNLLLNATSLEGARSGHLFYGVNGAIEAPWGQSSHTLCVHAPTQRTPTQVTGGTSGACDGAMTLDWNAFSNANPGALGQPFSAGQDVWSQAFFRDPAGPKTTALSNALRFTICP